MSDEQSFCVIDKKEVVAVEKKTLHLKQMIERQGWFSEKEKEELLNHISKLSYQKLWINGGGW